jgi:hypothetical protein
MDSVNTVEIESNRGRPELYPVVIEPNLDKIYEWIAQGYTEKSIYDKLQIHHSTWIRYKEEYKELSDTITRARTAAGQLMLNKQFQKACGQVVTLKKQKTVAGGDIVDVFEEQYIPPDTNAAEFWGRHMMPEYKAPKAVESGNITINNFQLEDIQKKKQEILQEIRKLEMQSAVDLEPVE